MDICVDSVHASSVIEVQLSAELHGSFWSEVDGRSDALKPVDFAHIY